MVEGESGVGCGERLIALRAQDGVLGRLGEACSATLLSDEDALVPIDEPGAASTSDLHLTRSSSMLVATGVSVQWITTGITPAPENDGAPAGGAGAPSYELLRLDSNQQPSD